MIPLVTRLTRKQKLRTTKLLVNKSQRRNNYSSVLVSNRGGNQYATQITINKPDIHNAFNEVIMSELVYAFQNINPQNTRVVILTGNGPSFSAGADLNWMKRRIKLSQAESEAEAVNLWNLFYSIKMCPVPTIARINGSALGGGCGLVAACDMAFAGQLVFS
eukprot:TRINITY_DN2684_c0_g1_i2.p1 TRINITY_DN2684_c0_g1~~TRINITY_DN2684_c0_g1_i2.p1  ORF type:complete len:162 (-),score=25.17 TRINITY_DN2684_c0_g1_i2:334-819(-)